VNDGLVRVKPEGMGKMGDGEVEDEDEELDVDVDEDEELFVFVATDEELVDVD